MQRIYDVPRKKKIDTAEFFELRENTQQEQQQFEMKPPASYKIPSSSNMLAAASGGGSNRTYKPASVAYDDGKDKDRPHQQTPYVSPRSIHCVVIADHIMDCPICSRFYRNYTPFYNVVFLILLTILIFLFIRCQKLSFVAAKHFITPSSS